jgi:hypothetical protein
MKQLIILSLFLLASCACDPVVNTTPVIVKVPTPVPCKIAPIEKPVYGFSELKKEDTIFKKIQVLLSDRELRKAYERKLEAATKECQ